MSSRETEPLKAENGEELEREKRRLKAKPLHVAVVEGPSRGLSVRMEGTLVVGSGELAQLRLTDSTVSRAHAELTLEGTRIRVRDLDSRNGTFMGGARIEDALVGEDAVLVLGKSTLRFTRGPAPTVAEPRRFGQAVSVVPSMVALFDALERAAQTQATVLLLGETGSGKELLARAVHDASPRSGGPFVPFDCASVAPSLIESDLFGHRQGAFTGADAEREGAFARASGGTLFLDEVGEMPPELQPRLLRGLEDGVIRRVGEDSPRKVNVRVIAATHRDLQAEVKAGRFREDLYFRLEVVTVRVPPLRERRADIPVLARQFVLNARRPEFQLSGTLLARMEAYDWPGNVRELRNFVERALAGMEAGGEFQAGGPKGPKVTEAEKYQDLPFKEAKEKLLMAFTREYLAGLLERTDGNVSEVARLAGIARTHVHLLLTRYGLKPRNP